MSDEQKAANNGNANAGGITLHTVILSVDSLSAALDGRKLDEENPSPKLSS
jgi:hypothetical protein